MKIEITEAEDGELLVVHLSNGDSINQRIELDRDEAELLCEKLSEALGHEDPQK